MKNFFVYIVATALSHGLFSQTLPKNLNQAKWQQQVNFHINVSLDTINQTLSGNIAITYLNNSPNSLNQIYMHLWPNAYKNKNTAFAKQQVENGKTLFHFSKKEDKGFIDSLQFSVNQQSVKWYLTQNIDIAILELNQPLLSGESIIIETPFIVKLPAVFSRAGHEDGIYCVTQWYPKPAVYDVNGWNPMPYLDQGEFYSEFGSFNVNITVPKNLKVAATGTLQTKAELNWLTQLAYGNKTENPELGSTKTLTFTQDKVHDFAWFASKDFKVLKDSVVLQSGKIIDTWLFAKNPTRKGVLYINDGVKFYSDKIGEYPYPLATVVITPLKAGGGMEYPTITNCASIDETTIIHEVGHNWFYGILASNEREYPYMDESFNTFYENWHGEIKNQNQKRNSAELSFSGLRFGLTGLSGTRLMYQYSARQNKDQAGNIPSINYTDNNYGTIVYGKNPLAIFYLKNYLGEEIFTTMMQAYYEKWKFKHPLPNDLKHHCETFTGKNLDWFFNNALGDGKYDVKFSKNNDSLIVKNISSGVGPIPISLTENGKVKQTIWVEPIASQNEFAVSLNSFITNDSLLKSDKKASVIHINNSINPLELYGQNNQLNAKSRSLHTPIKFSPILNVESDTKAEVFFAPVYAYNVYNKSMLGAIFYNSLQPQKKNEFVVMPVYAFGSKDINGYLQYWHNFYPSGKIQKISAGFISARFGSFGLLTKSDDPRIDGIIKSYGAYSTNTSYEKFAPFVRFTLKPKNSRSNIEQEINLRYVMINENYINDAYFSNFTNHIGIADLGYNYKNNYKLYPSEFNFNYQFGVQNSAINRLSLAFTQSLLYSDGKKTADIRFFGGTFLNKQDLSGNTISGNNYGKAMFQAAGTTGSNDYLYDYAMFGRAQDVLAAPQNDFLARQVILRDAGFRNFVKVGSTDSWILATNLTLPFPIKIPIGIYADASYGNLQSTTNNVISYNQQFNYIGGVYISIAKNVLAWYIPIVQSNNINETFKTQGLNNFFERSSIVINLNKLNPIKAIRDIKF